MVCAVLYVSLRRFATCHGVASMALTCPGAFQPLFVIFDHFFSVVCLLMGMLTALKRLLIIVFSLVFSFWRLDLSWITIGDSGHGSYNALLLVTHIYNNPVAMVFSDLVFKEINARRHAKRLPLRPHEDWYAASQQRGAALSVAGAVVLTPTRAMLGRPGCRAPFLCVAAAASQPAAAAAASYPARTRSMLVPTPASAASTPPPPQRLLMWRRAAVAALRRTERRQRLLATAPLGCEPLHHCLPRRPSGFGVCN